MGSFPHSVSVNLWVRVLIKNISCVQWQCLFASVELIYKAIHALLRTAKQIHMLSVFLWVKMLHREDPRCCFDPPQRKAMANKRQKRSLTFTGKTLWWPSRERKQEAWPLTPFAKGGVLLHSNPWLCPVTTSTGYIDPTRAKQGSLCCLSFCLLRNIRLKHIKASYTCTQRSVCCFLPIAPDAWLVQPDFISQLLSNYTQWSDSGVGAKGWSAEREVQTSGLMVVVGVCVPCVCVYICVLGGHRGEEEWVAMVEGLFKPHYQAN